MGMIKALRTLYNRDFKGIKSRIATKNRQAVLKPRSTQRVFDRGDIGA